MYRVQRSSAPGKPRVSGDRRGIALALTLWALVIGSALLTVAVFLGFKEARASAAGRRLPRALARAESGLAEALAAWTPGLLSRRLPQPFDSLVISGAGLGQDEDWRGVIHRLNPGLFLLEVNAADPLGTEVPRAVATHVLLGWLVGVRPVRVVVSAALSTGGHVTVGDGSTVSGRDQPPPSWAECPPPDSDAAGIDAESVTVAGSARIEGSPPISRRLAGDSGLTVLEARAFDLLASQATITIPGGSLATGPVFAGTGCDVTSPRNWGDPSSPESVCGGYLPIVHVVGDLALVGGVGQGILLVDGNLTIAGQYQFHGLVMVRGLLDARGGVTILGGVVASGARLETQATGRSDVLYSKCLIDRALQTSGTLWPLRSRAWKQLF